jgi:hypothetical protein
VFVRILTRLAKAPTVQQGAIVPRSLSLLDPDAIVLVCAARLRSSDVCLACLHADATFELLTGAWEQLLGYRRAEFSTLRLGDLLAADRAAAAASLQQLLDRRRADPVLVQVRVKGGGVRSLNVYRRFEDQAPSVYFACEPFEEEKAPKSVISWPSSALSAT